MKSRSSLATRARSALLVLVTTSTLVVAANAAASSVWYAGPGPAGRPTTLELTVSDDGTAVGRVFESPAQAGERVGIDLTFEGTAARESTLLRIDAIAVGSGVPSEGVRLQIVADATPRRGEGPSEPDPLGNALVNFVPSEGIAWRASLPAIAIGVRSRTSLEDGTLEVSAFGPFFYAEPWADLEVAPDPTDLAESILTGLEQRRSFPATPSGVWWDERTVDVAALTGRIASVRLTFYAFTGGAHPNTWYAFATWLRSDEAWRRADVCGTLRALDYACDPVALREAIVASLAEQDASWVVDGSVDATTPWLLDPFTVTATGLRFDYAPYDVGPYAQGAFQVVLPFGSLPAR